MKWTIRPLFFESTRPGALEGYLEYMARRGWRFRSAFAGIGMFDAAPPAQTRYRVENVQSEGQSFDDDLDAAQQDFYREGGWEYLRRMAPGQYLFRADDPAAPEFHTDPAIEADTYRELLRRAKRSQRIAWAALCLWLLFGGAMLGCSIHAHGIWGAWVRLIRQTYNIPIWAVIFAGCIVKTVREGRQLRRLGRLAATGRLAQEREAWRRPRRVYTAIPLVELALLLLIFGGFWYGYTHAHTFVARRDLPSVTLEEIDGTQARTAEWNYLPAGLMRAYYSQREDSFPAKDDFIDGSLLTTEYYELWGFMPAEAVTREIADLTIGLDPDRTAAVAPQIDQLYCDLTGDMVTLTARCGRKVLSFLYIGPEPERARMLALERLSETADDG